MSLLSLLLTVTSLYSAETDFLIAKSKKSSKRYSSHKKQSKKKTNGFVRKWMEFDPDLKKGKTKNFNILPLVVSSPEQGQGFGIKYAQESLVNTHDIIRVQALHTMKNRSSYGIKYEFPPDEFGIEFDLSYQKYGRFYYGIGNTAKETNKSEYRADLFALKVPLLFGITKSISGGVLINFEDLNVKKVDPTSVLAQDLPNLVGSSGSRIFTTGFLIRWDNRDSKTDPARGSYIGGSFEHSKMLMDSDTDFNRAKVEVRKFFPIFNGANKHVIAQRYAMDHTSGNIPFFYLPQLGGVFYNRGLIEGRFRDTLSFTGNWEYRIKLFERLRWAFFIDAGNVYNKHSSISLSHTKITGGSGMRYYVPPGNLLLARVDGGVSSEGFLLYLTFDHPF